MIVSGGFDIKGIVDGASVVSVTAYWLASPLSSGVTKVTEGWTTEPQVTTPTNKYLWQYLVTKYSDDSRIETDPAIISVHGEKGEDAKPIKYNMYKGSDFLEVLPEWLEYPQNQVIVENIEEMGGRNGLKKVYIANTSNWVDMAVLTQLELDVKMKPNTWYTLSFWAKGTCGSFVTIFYQNGPYSECLHELGDSESWHYFTHTYQTSDSIPNMTGFWRFRSGELTICMPKLEEGDTATPWCLALSETKAPESDMVKWEDVPAAYKFYAGEGSERKHAIAWYKGLWYSCKKTHVKNEHVDADGAVITPQYDVANNLGYWVAATYMQFIASDLALSRKIVANEIETEGMVVGQLRTSGDGSTILIQNGVIEFFRPDNPLEPNIRMGVLSDGLPVIQFFKDGQLRYDLGPDGITDIDVREEKWLAFHRKYLGTSEQAVMAAKGYIGVLYDAGVDIYKYAAKMVAGVSQDTTNDGRYFSDKIKNSIHRVNGWYCWTAMSGQTSEMAMQYVAGGIPSDISVYNPSFDDYGLVYFKTLEYYEDGLLVRRQNVYWSV